MEKSGWVVTGWWSGEDFFQRRRGPHAQRSIGHTNADLLPRALPIKAQKCSMSIRLTACTSLFDRLPTCAALLAPHAPPWDAAGAASSASSVTSGLTPLSPPRAVPLADIRRLVCLLPHLW